MHMYVHTGEHRRSELAHVDVDVHMHMHVHIHINPKGLSYLFHFGREDCILQTCLCVCACVCMPVHV